MSNDYVFRGRVADLDPELNELLEREKQRQERTIILIPSESAAPDAVEEALGSKFGNIYAEGYPREASRKQTEAEILDFEAELAYYRRNSDPRYYKGVEYADVLEALARRRAADLFSANGVKPEQLYVNVQPLSGGPANSAVYTALLQPGDTIMGLKLSDGGHLSHGAPVNRSGVVYKSVSYVVDSQTELLDYDAVEKLAVETKPKIIVAGFSAYPLIIDWARFRAIADKVGAYLHADISHISGLVAAGVHPSPIGIADTVMTTTHKSLCGPRGAMILTHRADLADKLDRAVFPGEQGGAHFNAIAGLAVALKLAQSEQFKQLQTQIVKNATRLAEKLTEHGLRVVGGRSENHLLLIDCRSVKHPETGLTLDGDSAARILDIAGIVVNRNTIPGDKSALLPSGVRLGTVWISQLGYKEPEIDLLAEAIALLLKNSLPFEYADKVRQRNRRAKVRPEALQRAREIVRILTKQEPEEFHPEHHTLRLRGKHVTQFLNMVCTSDVLSLKDSSTQPTHLIVNGQEIGALLHRGTDEKYYLRFVDAPTAANVKLWLQDLSDGYLLFADEYAKLPGPITVEYRTNVHMSVPEVFTAAFEEAYVDDKPFFVGQESRPAGEPLPAFSWTEPASSGLKKTLLHATHVAAGAKMVEFGGYDMPVWYTSVSDEHKAVREGAALFDVSHMGVWSVTGPHAQEFLQLATANDVNSLAVGKSQYTYFLYPNGDVVDDLMIYRLGEEEYMVVVNASNNDKDWAWLSAVNQQAVCIDQARPWAKISHPAVLRDIRAEGQRVLIALQGPKSAAVLAKLAGDGAVEKQLLKMGWASIKPMKIGAFELIVSRSGYTGEKVGYELFVHPDKVAELWLALVTAGATQAGLASRDSTRTEAGLPLYGHELAGPQNIDPDSACFGMYLKTWKPFFIGRRAYLKTFASHENTIVRFKMDEKGVRRPEQGDPIVDKRGKVVGVVTSCAIGADGVLVGLALVPMSYKATNTQLLIYQTSGGTKELALPKEMKLGAKLPKPDSATVLNRFPKK